MINKNAADDKKNALFSGEFAPARGFFDALENEGERMLTEQDKALYSLCRPERLLELTYRFTLFDGGIKKIARYQQFFVIRSTVARIKRRDREGIRTGGVIWHTQGSGKSLTIGSKSSTSKTLSKETSALIKSTLTFDSAVNGP